VFRRHLVQCIDRDLERLGNLFSPSTKARRCRFDNRVRSAKC
jgi:hypothetical protein